MKSNLRDESVKLLQRLIQNRCVNDGTEDSGNELRSVNTLIEYFREKNVFDNEYVTYKVFETGKQRANLLVRLRGSGGDSSVAYQSHLDVVPANPDGWDVDPFGGVIKDGFVYGRGSVDMLVFTACQAVAFAQLVAEGFTPSSDLVFLAVADEEMGGKYGAKWLVENAAEEIKTTYLIGEFGGAVVDTPHGKKTGLMIAEKGPAFVKMTIQGNPGHASFSYKVGNALSTASKIIHSISNHPPPAVITDSYRQFVKGLGVGIFNSFLLTNPRTVDYAISKISAKDIGMARLFHALTHMTINPTIVRGGTKNNVLPDKVEITFDVRMLPGQDSSSIRNYFTKVLGEELMSNIQLEILQSEPGSSDPWESPLIASIEEVYSHIEPEKDVIPLFLPAVTDSRIFRKLGIKCYGFAVMTEKLDLKTMMESVHGNNERVPVEAVEKTTEFFYKLAHNFLGNS